MGEARNLRTIWRSIGRPTPAVIPSVILQHSDGKWEPVASPTATGLSSVRMVSANEGWAVGIDFSSEKGASLRYHNGQ